MQFANNFGQEGVMNSNEMYGKYVVTIQILIWSPYLGVDADDLVAFLASVGEDTLVALDAIGLFISQDVALSGEGLIALPAAEVTAVPVLVHRLGVFTAENELQKIIIIMRYIHYELYIEWHQTSSSWARKVQVLFLVPYLYTE